jgi:hypothetical protein
VHPILAATGRQELSTITKRINAGAVGLSAKCHKRTHAPQQKASSLNHLVGAGEQRWPEWTRTIYLVIT